MTNYYKDKTLPNRFRECRDEKKLSQPALSKLLGFKGGKETVGCYERNKRIPSIPTLIEMRTIFNVSLDYLLCLDEFKSHEDYAIKEIGLNHELILLLLESASNDAIKSKINEFILKDLDKNGTQYEY